VTKTYLTRLYAAHVALCLYLQHRHHTVGAGEAEGLDMGREILGKDFYVPALARTLAIHGFLNYLELYLLHRHFIIQEGEAIVHKN
jgi:hypothetical protein